MGKDMSQSDRRKLRLRCLDEFGAFLFDNRHKGTLAENNVDFESKIFGEGHGCLDKNKSGQIKWSRLDQLKLVRNFGPSHLGIRP